MKSIFSKEWFKAAAVRAIKTVAQTLAATVGTAVIISDVNWRVALGAAALAGFLSLLTSLAGLPEVNRESEAAFDGF